MVPLIQIKYGKNYSDIQLLNERSKLAIVKNDVIMMIYVQDDSMYIGIVIGSSFDPKESLFKDLYRFIGSYMTQST